MAKKAKGTTKTGKRPPTGKAGAGRAGTGKAARTAADRKAAPGKPVAKKTAATAPRPAAKKAPKKAAKKAVAAAKPAAKPSARPTASMTKPGAKPGAKTGLAVLRMSPRRSVKNRPPVPRPAAPRRSAAPRISKNPYDVGLDRNAANFAALTPLTFLERAASTFPDHPAVVHGDRRFTWKQTYARARQLASALVKRGIGAGDTVAIMAPNIPEFYEASFGIPMSGAVLNSLNIRLDAKMIAFILEHSETKVLFTDLEFAPVMKEALAQLANKPLVIDIADPLGPGGERLGAIDYEAFIADGDPNYDWQPPSDEWNAIALNYTSGTTGNPKGVVTHHRGAHLNAIGNALTWHMPAHPIYLWTLPMFHANGWCFPWTMAAVAGVNICLRRIDASRIFNALVDHKVTHMCGAPVILNFIINATPTERKELPHPVHIMTAAAPPPPAVLEAIEQQGFKITHVYGLTETYGPAVVCEWHAEWDALPPAERARLKARQGVRYPVLEALRVMDPATMTDVPADGQTMGEVMFKGHVVMKGYLKNPTATTEAFEGGWFHSGDLAVMHPDGYIELRDRSKDIIISGGENISTIEVEGVLYKHPAVLEAAVVARPDDKWGETPCAFITLKTGHSATADEIIAFCRQNMARYKVPRTVVFRDLPKTSTGKVQKFVLRQWAKEI
jgi:fatty-acyl-CoA synthase